MKYDVLQQVAKLKKMHLQRQRWMKIVTCMAAVVVFCTTYALILPAITMENPVCGLEEHEHSMECYEQVTTIEQEKLTCSEKSLELHEHQGSCFGENGKNLCGYADFVIHTHDAKCFDENGVLCCELPEIKVHEHKESCYAKTKSGKKKEHAHSDDCYTLQKGELICTKTEGEGHAHGESCYTENSNLVCTLVESDGHQHTDSCYTETSNLICTQAESDGHHHGEGCYNESGELICGTEESDGHHHSDGCYEKSRVLNCQLPEEAGHHHDISCFETTRELTCQLEETAGHQHSDDCYAWEKVLDCELSTEKAEETEAGEPKLICQTEEVILHKHTDKCKDAAGNLNCGKIEVLEHQHTDECFEMVEVPADTESLTCTLEENAEHKHTELCYGTWNQICGLEQHEHSEECWGVEESESETETDVEGETGKALEMTESESETESETTEISGAAEEKSETESDAESVINAGIALLSLEEEVLDNTAGDDTENLITITFNIPDTYDGHIDTELEFPYEITIPQGTSLNDNEISLPKLSVKNLAGSEVTYLSAYSWVTTEGLLCNAKTVFETDTELTLCLYQDGENYSLNFVCGDENNHSITYYVSGYGSPTFTMGQSVDAAWIPTADDVNEKYVSAYCSHGSKSGEVFDGWYVQNQDGEEIAFEAGMTLTADYLDPNATRTIKVYAHWLKTTTPVTAIFLYGDETIESKTCNAGETLGTLPDMSGYETEEQRFLGWSYVDAEGNTVYASEDTVIDEDTVYTAVFGEFIYYNVILHDIDENGEESGMQIDLSVLQGETLESCLQEITLEDGTVASDCIWHLSDDSDEYDLTAPVEGDLELYTYTYQITLQMQSSDDSESEVALMALDLEVNGDVITITLREGQTLSASDFIIDGVDYSFAAWTDADGNTVYSSDLIGTTITENRMLTLSSSVLAEATGTTDMTVNFYVFIDEEKELLETKTVKVYQFGEARYYISAAELEVVYGAFGFKAEDISSDSRLFPHTATGDTTIWGDAGPVEKNGIWFSPVLNYAGTCDVYYIPVITITESDAWANHVSTDTFYSVTVFDPMEKVYDAESLPEVTYVLTGGTAVVTLQQGEYNWAISGGTASETVENSDGTITYTVENVTEPLIFYLNYGDNNCQVLYDINLPSESMDVTPTIEGEATWTDVFELTDDGTYVVKTPSAVSYQYQPSSHWVYVYTFDGWSVKGTNELLLPGQVLTKTEFDQYALGGLLELTGKWSQQEVGNTVNFYVNLTCQMLDYEGNTDVPEAGDFTGAVYGTTTTVNGNNLNAENWGNINSSQYIVLQHEDNTNAAEIDAQIRSLVNTPYEVEYNSEKYSFSLADFPDDEEVLKTLRTMVENGTNITLNGTPISADQLTTENFTVRWYVFKFDKTSDYNWHIDGVLVQKAGKLRIQKTFYGDETAVDTVKKNYQIQVYNTSAENADTPEQILNLENYTGYDSATDTYTWVIGATRNVEYIVKEENYSSSIEGMATLSEYILRNSDSANAGVWKTYDAETGIGVTIKAYATDVDSSGYQTVSMVNSYIPTNSIMIQKVDDSGYSLGSVTFNLEKQGENGTYTAQTVWKDVNGIYYIYDPSQNVKSTQYEDGSLTVDSSGRLMLVGLKDKEYAGTYKLTENVPEGYAEIGEIIFTVSEDGSIQLSNDNEFVTLSQGDLVSFRIINTSDAFDLKVEKQWTDNKKLSITLALYLNGSAMGDSYTIELDGNVDENETTAWQYTWENLPKYVGGSPAQYTVRETWIDKTAYSSTIDSDGYANYAVNVEPMIYYGENDEVVSSAADAAYGKVIVQNQVDNGSLSFKKVDEDGNSLSGATFVLYSDEACTQQVYSAVSGTDGVVNFGTVAPGTYYMKETVSPEGYQSNETVYQVVITGKNSSITAEEDGTSLTQIVNRKDVAVVVKKVDASGNVLTGAKFSLEQQNAEYSGDWSIYEEMENLQVDTNGNLELGNLPAGTYRLVETAAPDGYNRLSKTIVFTISQGIVTLADVSDSRWSLNQDEEGNYILTVVNNTSYELPMTGGPGTNVYTLGGIGLMMVAVLLLYRKNKYGKEARASS